MKLLVVLLRVWLCSLLGTFIPWLSIAFVLSVFTDATFLGVTGDSTFWVFVFITKIVMLIAFSTYESEKFQ
jgi:hypothetical protein